MWIKASQFPGLFAFVALFRAAFQGLMRFLELLFKVKQKILGKTVGGPWRGLIQFGVEKESNKEKPLVAAARTVSVEACEPSIHSLLCATHDYLAIPWQEKWTVHRQT